MTVQENLFGEEYACAENTCAKKKKTGKKNSTATSKRESNLEKELPSRNIQVKIYSDFYQYEAPEDLEKPTLEDVRKWMVTANGFTELSDPQRAGLAIIEPEGEDPYIYCGVKFEKMG